VLSWLGLPHRACRKLEAAAGAFGCVSLGVAGRSALEQTKTYSNAHATSQLNASKSHAWRTSTKHGSVATAKAARAHMHGVVSKNPAFFGRRFGLGISRIFRERNVIDIQISGVKLVNKRGKTVETNST